jgi:hypothetical protein
MAPASPGSSSVKPKHALELRSPPRRLGHRDGPRERLAHHAGDRLADLADDDVVQRDRGEIVGGARVDDPPRSGRAMCGSR